MTYVVLARKYRPQRFAELIGQEHVTRTLANAIAHDRIHHAYLFCGARGLGKTSAARLLAKCLVCEQGPTIDPCNECHECRSIIEGRSVDVSEIDGASNNKVENVRNLREQVRYLPQTARRRIYIIDEVHMLTGSAFNALLKTLEEPPPHVTFIFATTEVHALPATILSRVSRFDFRRLAPRQLVAHMQTILAKEGLEIEEGGLYTVARAGDGSVRDSLTLLDKVIAFAGEQKTISEEEVRIVIGVPARLAVIELAEAVLARDPTKTLQRFNAVVESGQDMQLLALALLQHLRDLLVVKLTGSRDVLVNASDAEYEQLTAQAKDLDATVLSQLFDRLARVVDTLPRTRVPRLILEVGLLELVHTDPLIPLGGLIERLEQIGGGGQSSGAPPSRGPSRFGGQPPPGRGRSAQGQAHSQPPTPAPPAQQRPERSARPTRPERPARPTRPERPERSAPPNQRPANAPPGRGGYQPTSTFQDQLMEMARQSGAIKSSRRSHAGPPNEPPPAPPRPGSRPGPPPGSRAGTRPGPQNRNQPPTARTPPGPPPQDCVSQTCPSGRGEQPKQDPIAWTELKPFEAWEQLTDRLRPGNPSLYALLSECGLQRLSGDRLQLVTKQGGVGFGQLAGNTEYRSALEAAIRTHFDASVQLEVLPGEAGPQAPSLTMVQAKRRDKHQREVEQEARDNPAIQELVHAFAGNIRDVRPL